MNQQQRDWMKLNYEAVDQLRTCVDCEGLYEAPGRDTNSLRCTPCRENYRRQQAKEWNARNPRPLTDKRRSQLKASKHRRRVRIIDARRDYFAASEVYCRDGWTCQICGLSIDLYEKFPSRDSASLDHIIPISKGGTHTLDNVQLACMGCNWDKGDRLVA